MKPIDVKSCTYTDSNKKELIIKILNLKLLILLEYQNIKIILQKAMLQIGLKKFLLLQKLKLLFRGHMLLVILKVQNLLERFTKKKENRQEKKGNKLYVKWKGYDSSFNSFIDKKT